MKKWLSVLLSVVLLMGLLPLGVAADSGYVTMGGITYWVGEDAAYLEYVEDAEYFFGDLVLPEYVYGKPLLGIYDINFCDNLYSVTIPATVEYISGSAFSGCSNLTNIYVAAGNENYCDIDGVLFSYWEDELVKYPAGRSGAYTIPDSVWIIGYQAFQSCMELTSVTIPNGVYSIGGNAFSNCLNLTGPLVIPDSVYYIGVAAFAFCASLDSIKLSANVEYIGEYAFEYASLSSISLASSNRYYCVENNVLFNKDKTTLVLYAPELPATSYTVPASVKRIEPEAFLCATALETIDLPDALESIGMYAFSGTGYSNNAKNWTNGMLYLDNCLVETAWDFSEQVTIQQGTKLIADYAFYCNDGLERVTIPDSVKYIGTNAFSGCSSLLYVSIGNGVKTIGEYAFSECSSLTSIRIPDSVTTIGDSAFIWSGALSSIHIGTGVTTLGSYAFNDTGYYNNAGNWENGMLYIGTYLVASDWGMEGDVVIKDGTTIMSDNIFEGRSWITSVTLPESVIHVAYSAFASCASLTEVTIPGSVVSIDDFAFAGCWELSDVYYGGTDADKDNIDVGYDNWSLNEATWHYSGCNHAYDHGCDTTCNLCGAVRDDVTHEYTDKCDAACDNCGAQRTPPHDYLHYHDDVCDGCGATREVVALKAGDANGDGKVNVRDLGVLQQYLNGWDVGHLGTDPACDANGDGKLNVRDVGLLQQYINGWDVTLKLPA